MLSYEDQCEHKFGNTISNMTITSQIQKFHIFKHLLVQHETSTAPTVFKIICIYSHHTPREVMKKIV